MPNWFTKPLISAEMIDRPSLARSPSRARLEGFLGGITEDNSSPLDAALWLTPWGKLGKVAKTVPGALQGLRKALPTAIEHTSPGILEQMVKETAEGGVQDWLRKTPQPVNRWIAGASPKPGGALHKTLSQAGEKSATGQHLTPGEKGLLAQFTQYALGRH